MNKEQSVQLAQALLDSEFEDANNNPDSYCQAMSWDKNSKGTEQAIEKKGQINFDKCDVQKLADIIEKSKTDEVIDICESNSVHDFHVNCVARHIIS